VTEGHTWHSPITQAVKGESKPNAGAQAQGGNNNNNRNKTKAGGNRPLVEAPTAATAVASGGRGGPRGDKCPASHPIVMVVARSV
jgi:hypothetical protein